MRLDGFKFTEDAIGIESAGQYIDLHNCYDFIGVEYKVEDKKLSLTWKKGEGEYVDPRLPSSLRIEFTGVYMFKAKQRDPEMPFTEDNCVQSIGFMWDNMIENMESAGSATPKDGCNHLVVDFMSGFAMKIGAEAATVKTGK